MRTMKSVLTILLITGFVSVAVFGFIGIGHINEAAHHGCLAALSQNGICPSASGAPLAAAFSHMNILRSFSTALLANALLLLALAAAALFALNNSGASRDTYGRGEIFFHNQREDFAGNNFFNRTLSWLNFHLNSPSYAVSA